MVHCERCSSRFHSARALMIENCPRCLLRDDVASPLVVDSAESAQVESEPVPPDSDPVVGTLAPEPS